MKGLVLGPIHKNPKDDVNGTDLEQIDPIFGTKEEFYSLLHSAKKKSRCPGVGEEGVRKGLAFWPEGRQERIIVWFILVQGFPRVGIKEAGTNPARNGFVRCFRDLLIGRAVTSFWASVSLFAKCRVLRNQRFLNLHEKSRSF